jgi:hypothetical protein
MNARLDTRSGFAIESFTKAKAWSRAAAQEHLCSHYPDLFQQHRVEDYICMLDETQQGKSMFDIPERVRTFWHTVTKGWGIEGLEIFHRVTMLALMDAFAERASQYNYPASVLQQFRLSFMRIENNILQGQIGTYSHTGDSFLKDFSLCRQTAFPGGGAWIIDHHGAFPRSVMFKGGIGQFFRLAHLCLFVTRGNRPTYSPHIHNDLVKWHTWEERQACHLRIAEMLERHPQVKGMAVASWLSDPVIEKISPQLRWVRKIPAENGCQYFRVGEDINGGALSRSATRRKLYEEGKYIPTKYLYIWPRNSMLSWAKRVTHREDNSVQVRSYSIQRA